MHVGRLLVEVLKSQRGARQFYVAGGPARGAGREAMRPSDVGIWEVVGDVGREVTRRAGNNGVPGGCWRWMARLRPPSFEDPWSANDGSGDLVSRIHGGHQV